MRLPHSGYRRPPNGESEYTQRDALWAQAQAGGAHSSDESLPSVSTAVRSTPESGALSICTMASVCCASAAGPSVSTRRTADLGSTDVALSGSRPVGCGPETVCGLPFAARAAASAASRNTWGEA